MSCERQTSSYRLKEMEKGRLMVRVNGRYHDVDDDDWSFDPCPCLSAYLKHAPRSHSGASPSPLSRATHLYRYHRHTTPDDFIMSHKAPLVVPALKRHTATVIVAHGLGDSGAGW